MTREEIETIRLNVSFNDVSIHDVISLLAEVERLTGERDAAKPKASTVCTFLFPSGQWGWFVTPGPLAASVVTHPTRREAEDAAEAHVKWAGWPAVNRFNCQAEGLNVSVERDSLKRGVAAMREAAAKECWKASDVLADIPDMTEQQGELQILARRIRALPDPEDKP